MQDSEGAPLLRVHRLTVAVGDSVRVRGISIDVAPGDLIAVVGPSGAGKTTLLRAIAGLIDAVEGEVALRGRTPAQCGWPSFRRQVLLVEQQASFLEATVEAQLRHPFTYRSANEPYPADRAAMLLERLGIGAHRLRDPARSLSVGEQQRLSLIRALLLEPAVLLLDEPTSALDPEATRLVEELLAEVVDVGHAAALIVTHDPEQAARLCNRQLDIARPALATPQPA